MGMSIIPDHKSANNNLVSNVKKQGEIIIGDMQLASGWLARFNPLTIFLAKRYGGTYEGHQNSMELCSMMKKELTEVRKREFFFKSYFFCIGKAKLKEIVGKYGHSFAIELPSNSGPRFSEQGMQWRRLPIWRGREGCVTSPRPPAPELLPPQARQFCLRPRRRMARLRCTSPAAPNGGVGAGREKVDIGGGEAEWRRSRKTETDFQIRPPDGRTWGKSRFEDVSTTSRLRKNDFRRCPSARKQKTDSSRFLLLLLN